MMDKREREDELELLHTALVEILSDPETIFEDPIHLGMRARETVPTLINLLRDVSDRCDELEKEVQKLRAKECQCKKSA